MNGIETTGLIDTGSEISTVSEQFWNSLNPKPEIHVVQELEIKCADGNTLPYRGVVELTIGVPTLQEDLVSALFLVVPATDYNKTVPFIVGTNVIREFQKSNSADIPEAWKVAFNLHNMLALLRLRPKSHCNLGKSRTLLASFGRTEIATQP